MASDSLQTRQTLIGQIKDFKNSRAWAEFDRLYGDLLYRYARRRGLKPADADEIKSQCLLAVVQKMPEFDYDPRKGRFRSWLFQIAHYKIIDRMRRQREYQADTGIMEVIKDESASPDGEWDQTWRHSHLRYCLSLIKPQVSPQKYHVFELLALQEKPVEEVCATCGINTNQAYKAKSLVLAKLRELMSEFDLEL